MISFPQRIGWFEMVLPVLFGALVWGCLTYILYSGSSDSLADRAERYLIERTLEGSQWESNENGLVQTVTLTTEDHENHAKAPSRVILDAHIDVYIRALEEVMEHGPEKVFLVWNQEAHRSDPAYFRRLVKTLDKYGPERVVLVVAKESQEYLPSALASWPGLRALDPCSHHVASACRYTHQFFMTAIEDIMREFWGFEANKAPKFHLSENLPYQGPSFLLNLPKRAQGNEWSFSRLFDHQGREAMRGKIVFIGSDLTQNLHPDGSHAAGRITLPGDHFTKESIPYHVFLSLVAKMFDQRMTIGVPPLIVTQILLLLLCAIILVLMWRVGTSAALGIFLVYSLLYPLANDFGVRIFRVYLPMFDFVYAGLLTFLVATYGLLSVQSFKRWRLDARERSLANVSELKGNFISLVSHDLNTPVAKMQGLMEILWKSPPGQAIEADLLKIRREMARLQLCVRAVLMSTRIESGSLNEGVISLGNLQREFEERVAPTLEKLGVRAQLEMADEYDDLNHHPFTIDSRAVSYGLAGLVTLLGAHDTGKLRLSAHLKEVSTESEADPISYQLVFRIEAQGKPLGENAKALLFKKGSGRNPKSGNFDFVEEALIHLIKTLNGHYSGSVILTELDLAQRVVLNIFPRR